MDRAPIDWQGHWKPFHFSKISFDGIWQKKKKRKFILGGKKESLFVLGVCVCEECISYPVLCNKLTINLLTYDSNH